MSRKIGRLGGIRHVRRSGSRPAHAGEHRTRGHAGVRRHLAAGQHAAPTPRQVSLEDALATVRRTLEGPINFLDTGNNYGDSERRIGIVLRELGGIPDGFVLQTKVDRDMESGDFSGDRVRRSVEESLERLGLERLGLVHLHDPENITFEEGVAPGGPLEALQALRDEGLIAPPRGRGRADRPDAAVHPHRGVRRRPHAQPLLAGRPVGRAAARRGAGAGGRRAQRGAVRRRRARGRAGGAGLLRLPARRARRSSRGSRRWTPPAAVTTCRSGPPRCSSRCATRGSSRPSPASRSPSASSGCSSSPKCRSRPSSGTNCGRRPRHTEHERPHDRQPRPTAGPRGRALPRRLRLGHRDRQLPDRGGRRRGRALAVDLGHVLAHARARSRTATPATSPTTTTTATRRTST